MNRPILYLGDTSLDTAASYLAGCLANAGFEFDYRPSDQPLSDADLTQPHSLLIISDYPAANVPPVLQDVIVQQVAAGMGLLMIGGWESFQGADGHWAHTPIGDILPVTIADHDDRQNCDQPVFVRPDPDSDPGSDAVHPILTGLPWQQRPPLIGGYNLVQAKQDANLLLSAQRYAVSFSNDAPTWKPVSSDPLLIVTASDDATGRVAALLTDLAPHWVGPLVDWGDQRVQASAPHAEAIEVGSFYAQFVQQLVAWVGRLDC